MKQLFLYLSFTIFTVFAVQAQNIKADTIKVSGECGMCKNRIEKALKMPGIIAADYDPDTKLLAVKYNPDKITNDKIQKKVASVGHDTEKYRAEDSVYDKLPGCCQYERKAKE